MSRLHGHNRKITEATKVCVIQKYVEARETMCSISRTLNLAETTVAKILKEACVIIRPRGVKPGTPSKYNQMLLDPQYFHAAKLDYDFMIAAAVMNEEPKLRSPKAFTRFKRLKVEMAHA